MFALLFVALIIIIDLAYARRFRAKNIPNEHGTVETCAQKPNRRANEDLCFYKEAQAAAYVQNRRHLEEIARLEVQARTSEDARKLLAAELDGVLADLAHMKYAAIRLEETHKATVARLTFTCQSIYDKSEKHRQQVCDDLEAYRKEVHELREQKKKILLRLSTCEDDKKRAEVEVGSLLEFIAKEYLSTAKKSTGELPRPLPAGEEKKDGIALQDQCMALQIALAEEKECRRRQQRVIQRLRQHLEAPRYRHSDEARKVHSAIKKVLGVLPNDEFKIQDRLIRRRKFDFHFMLELGHYVVEYDGKQHFEPCGNFLPDPEGDRQKTLVAIARGFHVVRISYLELKDVAQHLKQAVAQKKKCYLSNPKLYATIGIAEVE